MTRSIYGRIKLENGYHSDTQISIGEAGWVYVDEAGKWYPPSQVRYIDPQPEEKPESEQH